MVEEVITCTGLSKHFRSGTSFADLLRGKFFGPRVDALRGIELSINQGEIVGVIGPNGAGKSTLLRLIAGLLVPDAGRLEVLGCDVARTHSSFRHQVCYVNCEERSFSWRLTGLQNLEFFAVLYGMRGRRAVDRVQSVLATVDLEADAGRPVREYSSGMRQRLALARGLLGDPRVFLFDEPTRGLDPATAGRLRRFIGEKVLEGARTAVIATHSLSDVGDLCSRVIALDRGKIASRGTCADAMRMIEEIDAKAPERGGA